MAERPAAPAPRRRGVRRALLAGLLGLGLLYLALLPRLRQMAAETERLRAQNAAGQAEAVRLAGLRQELEAARARVQGAPGDAGAHMDLAARCSDAGQLDEAARHARRAAELRPRDPEPRLLLAEIERQARRYDAAMQAYKAALAVAPGDQRALTGLAFLYVSFGWPFEAEALLEPAVRAAPKNPYLKVALAAAYTQHEDWGAAEKLLLEARRLAPEEPTLWSPLVHLYNQTRREQKAIATAREALARLPGNLPLLNEMAKAYYQLNDFSNAMSTLRQVLSLDPGNVPARYYLALCHQKIGQPGEAIRALEAVLRRDPNYAQTRLILGRLLLQHGRAQEGRKLLAEFREAQARDLKRSRAGLRLSTQPHSAEAHWQMARVYQEQGDLPRMTVELRKTLELAPNHAEARRLLAAQSSAGAKP